MGIIKIKNIRVYAYHGCLVEEGKIGSDYRVDLEVKADLKKSAQTDHLSDTVDYVHLNRIVKEEMAVRTKLLETVASSILDRILDELDTGDLGPGQGLQAQSAHRGQCGDGLCDYEEKARISPWFYCKA